MPEKVRKVTTLTLQHEGIEVTVRADVVSITDMVEYLVKPVLLAVGFHPKNVDEVLGGQ